MPRLHLFEFNDQPWLPARLRDATTGYIETISRKMGFHKQMAPVIADALELGDLFGDAILQRPVPFLEFLVLLF